MDTNDKWNHMAESGGSQVAARLHKADVVDALATRVSKGRQRRTVTQAGVTLAAAGALGIGAWGVVPALTDDAAQPAANGFALHVDESVEFLGRTDDEPWGPSWFECGDQWAPPADPGVTVPTEGASVPMLREVVVQRPDLGEWEQVFSGDMVAVESMPAIISYVSWDDPAAEPPVWEAQSFVALVDDEGAVMGIAFEQPPDHQEPTGPDASAGEYRVQTDLDLYYCPEVLAWDPDEGPALRSEDYLDGTFSLHSVTQVYSLPERDAGDGYEVLATFVDYERSEPFELSVDPSSLRTIAEEREEQLSTGAQLLTDQIAERGVPLGDVTFGIRPRANTCERVEVAQQGLGTMPVLPVSEAAPDVEIVERDGPRWDHWDEDARQSWLAGDGGMHDNSWWSGTPFTVLWFDEAGALAGTLSGDGDTWYPDDEDMTFAPLNADRECVTGEPVPGTYSVVVVTDGPGPHTQEVLGYSQSYEAWFHIGDVTLSD